MKKSIISICMMLFLFLPSISRGENISFLIIDGDSYLVNKAVKGLDLPEEINVSFFTSADIVKGESAGDFIASSRVIIVDVMMSELSEYLMENEDIRKKRVYALRGSRDDEGLKNRGFIFAPDIAEYFSNLSVTNIKNLIYRVANREIDPSIPYRDVERLPEIGIYHKEAKGLFIDYNEYLSWYSGRKDYDEKAPWLALTLFSSILIEGQVDAIDYLITRLEESGFNVLACVGRDEKVITSFLMDKKRKSRVDLVLAFSLKFYSALNNQLRSALIDLDVPVFDAINLYSNTIEEWQKSPVGIPPMDVVWTIANPEISGLIEPGPLSGKVKLFDKESGKELFVLRPIKENIELLIPRLKMWVYLKKKKNKIKKTAILYYNHSQGKQNVGASYLNVFRSLDLILKRMEKEGYQITRDKDLDEETIKGLILKYGRNIGSWASGELDRMIREKKVIRLPVATYKKWFERLPAKFRENVVKQWGEPEDSKIMIKNGEFIIPGVILDKVVMMPEPSRGWSDDPMKLYHDTTLYPHHQYIAAYLWLKHVFHADAMIHLGTHATHEWLPGKQAGLSPSCPPEVLITDIPNIYPYIVDDVGEGIQAKRRGRGVVIDHLIPAVKEGGLYHEYAGLYDMISSYNRAVSLDSDTAGGRLKKIEDLVTKLGINKDLGISKINDETLEKIEHYLLEIRENFMPYGMHTFGISPLGEGLKDTIKCIVKRNSEAVEQDVMGGLIESGPRELRHLIKALDGGYIPSGEGNDPIRNVGAIPTGKNFFGFDPNKIPSSAAWDLGREAAEQIIKKGLKEKGRRPEKVAVVLWAVETIRNEGINESTILHLMGLKPRWDKAGRVTGTEVIPGKKLGRPRIDVLINPSGLYRDLFPNMLLFLDKAVQKAAVQTDIENLISRHSSQIKTRLIESGMDEKRADILSCLRIFGEKPGSYGNGVSEMTGASGLWESDDEIVKVYENRTGFVFGRGKWGERAKDVFVENLKEVDTAVHSISSTIYGTMDNDDMFQFLGGLSLAVNKERGKTPDTLITMQRIGGRVDVEDVAKTIGRELRTRYFNPEWIEGMKKEDYAGAREMAKFAEYMWGWQVTTPFAVDKTRWEQTYEVYVKDKYGLEIKEFFNKANPWAYQSITARMLESIRKDYWKPDEKIRKKLAVEYAVNVIEKGMACCDHTCNNPLLNQMVVTIISLPGVMSPEMVEKFRLAIEQAMGKILADQVMDRKELQKKLIEGFDKKALSEDKKQTDASSDMAKDMKKDTDLKNVTGFKMEEKKKTDEKTDVSSSGVEWFASLFIILIIGLFVLGTRKPRGRLISVFLLVSIICFPLPSSQGAEHEAETLENKTYTLAPIVVTAEQFLEYVKNHPQNVVVLDRKEIRERNFLELGEAIDSMPGVDVRQGSGSMGARVIIRGGGGTGSVSILVDGRPVNSSQYGGVDLSSIPMETVNKVYVFKPPVPVWLGPGSTAGAVNIVTRGLAESSLKKKNRGRLKMRGGSYGAGDMRATYIIPQDRGKIILTAGGGHKDGKRPNSDRDSGDVSFNWSGKSKSRTKYDLNCRYYHNYHGCSGPVDNPTPDARQRYQKGSLDFQMDGIARDVGDFSVKAYVDMEDLKDHSQAGDTSTLDVYKIGMSAENIWSGDGGWALRLGGLAETNGVDHNISGDHHREKVSIHMQHDREIHDFTISLGIRGEHTNDFGYFPALRGGISYPLGRETLLKANGGYSVNVPAFNQLYQPSHGSIDQVRGNPDLDEEDVYSCDLGLEHKFSKDVALNVTLFRTDTRDYITYLRGVDLIYRPVNISRAYKQGVELSLTSVVSKRLSVDISYVYQDTEDEDRDDELYYSPQHNLKVTGKFHLPAGTKVETILKSVSHQYSSSAGGNPYKLDGHSVVNLKIIQPVPVEIFSGEFFVHFYNLFDTDFESHAGYPDDGVRFMAGMNINF